ncbi:MAG: hypothetical protein ACTSYL_11005 [Candidatus Thorarchaeota archaeon]
MALLLCGIALYQSPLIKYTRNNSGTYTFLTGSIQTETTEAEGHIDAHWLPRLSQINPPDGFTPLPTQTFHLHVQLPGISASWIDAPVTIEVSESHNSSTGAIESYDIGFRLNLLEVAWYGQIVTSRLKGIGIDEMREYPYTYSAFYNSDYWTDGTPCLTTLRPNQSFWSTTGAMSTFLSAVGPDALQQPWRTGDYISFDNVHLIFEDGTVIKCSPSRFVIWAEFQWNGTTWNYSNSSIWTFKSYKEYPPYGYYNSRPDLGNLVDENEIFLSMERPMPLDPVPVGLISTVPVGVCLVIIRKRRGHLWPMKRHKKSSKDGPLPEESGRVVGD